MRKVRNKGAGIGALVILGMTENGTALYSKHRVNNTKNMRFIQQPNFKVLPRWEAGSGK